MQPFASAIRSDKTFLVALCFVALLGALELAAIAFHYAGRLRVGPGLTQPGVVAPPAHPTGAEKSVIASGSLQPVLNAKEITATASPADHLLEEARRLRDRGDTTNALARLDEAVQLDPKNPGVLTEMAMIFESIKLFDKSNEYWRRVQDIGPAAGPLYELADLKLKMGLVPAPLSSPGSNSQAVNADGIAEGLDFGITELTATQVNDPDAEMHLTLRVAVKKREGAPIDYTKVKIQVFFYDQADGADPALTDADVSYEWLTPHHNWTDVNPEILSVSYLRPKKDAVLSSDASLSAAAAQAVPPVPGKRNQSSKIGPPPPAESDGVQHKYYGYIVRVFYRDQLEAQRADPPRLLTLFPAHSSPTP
jgi:tetratricopeptide (TPR) repeat protein